MTQRKPDTPDGSTPKNGDTWAKHLRSRKSKRNRNHGKSNRQTYHASIRQRVRSWFVKGGWDD